MKPGDVGRLRQYSSPYTLWEHLPKTLHDGRRFDLHREMRITRDDRFLVVAFVTGPQFDNGLYSSWLYVAVLNSNKFGWIDRDAATLAYDYYDKASMVYNAVTW